MPSLQEAAAALGPWWFRFDRDGASFGGTVERDREKTEWFFSAVARLGGEPRRILELGSHEGSHSLQLAGHPSVAEVVALEGRRENLARASFVKEAFGDRKIVFREYNIERLEPGDLDGPFDAVFCAGLLYHLPRPWALIERLRVVTRRDLFLDTHYATEAAATVEGHEGRWVAEGVDPLSGLSASSFWLTREDLTATLERNGFAVRAVLDLPHARNGPRVFVMARRGEAPQDPPASG
jgi:2-polyprenyl-3-methyl-5-hydroxy-6-metoxy-1,4-benzoquinol methylase